MLIDRIIKLQESNAKKAEKLDFFEEHARILLEELQKKKKIIQTYILHENIGAMGGSERDKYKVNFHLRTFEDVDNVIDITNFIIIYHYYYILYFIFCIKAYQK